MAEVKLYNDKGVQKTREELFNSAELAHIDHNQELMNAAGYGDIDLTLLTVLERNISEQKFYTVDPTKFVPFDTSTGGFADFITVLRSYQNVDGDLSTWERGNDTDNARRGQVGVKVESVALKIHNLDKMVSYSMFELRQAMQSGIWNLVTEKERARKRDYDLAVQKAVLLGDDDHKALLNQADVTVNTAVLTKKISAMNSTEFKTFLQTVFAEYFKHTEYTALPDTLVMPVSDFMGLGTAVDEQYPVFTTMFQRLSDVFKQVTGNANAEIIPLVYCEEKFHNGAYKYVLYRRDFDSIRAYQPFGYNVVNGATVDGVNYQNTAWARISDVFVNRPKEMLYLQFNA
jgi:hypothetical protein